MSPLRVSQRITAALLSAIVNTASLVADAVTNDKLANMGQGTIKLRAVSAGTGDPVDGTADQALAILASSSDFIWATKAIGEIVMLPTHLTGITEPPTSSSLYRYIKLTAGLTGGGQYNNGVLTGESTSGSAPLVLASATLTPYAIRRTIRAMTLVTRAAAAA